jgi:hypothetical protein
VLDGSEPDEILATITDHDSEPLYIVRVQARNTYSLLTIVLRHLRSPFLRPRLYPNLRYNVPSFSLLPSSTTQKLDPSEQVELRHGLSRHHPLSFFLTPIFIIEV